MIQSLHKSFRILELLSAEPQRDWPLSEVAARLGLHAATCAHVLKTLVELGYAEQPVPRGGYRLGVMPYWLVRHGAYRRDLTEAARGAMDRLADEVRETVQLIVLRQGRRFTLRQVDGGHDVQVSREQLADDSIYRTATGRLLLAHLPPAERRAWIERLGLPGDQWPGVRSRSALERNLDALRDEPLVVRDREQVVGLAAPTVEGDGVVAALGLFLPRYRYEGAHRKQVRDGLVAAAESISEALSHGAPRVGAGATL